MEPYDQPLDEKLHSARKWSLTVDVAAPLHVRLRSLVDLADDRGANTSLHEMVSALLLDAPESGDDLHALVVRYRTSVAGQALLDTAEDASVVSLRRTRPGRPRRTA